MSIVSDILPAHGQQMLQCRISRNLIKGIKVTLLGIYTFNPELQWNLYD